MKITIGFLSFMLIGFLAGVGFAGDDSSIPSSEKDKIKNTMVNYIKGNSTSNGNFLILDSQTKKTKYLRFDKVHKGVLRHHDGFLACVDMLEGDTVVDVDFVVSKDGAEYQVSKIAIHKVGGVKRKRHLDH